MKSTIILSDEKFNEIYSNEEFRNQVAGAHGAYMAQHEFKHFQTCSYPITYIVSQEQIDKAKAECEKAKALRIEGIKNSPGLLVFVGMGMTYPAKYEGDPGNYRIRTEFVNATGNRFFIEFGTSSQPDEMHVTHSIDRTKQDFFKDSHNHQHKFYNYGDLERGHRWKYSFDNIRDIINRTFDCHFTSVEVDNHNLSTDDFACISPKA